MKNVRILLIGFLVLFISFHTAAEGLYELETDISQHELTNGIPVIIKQSKTNRVQSLKVVLTNHSYHSTIAGLEALTLSLLVRGSENFTFDDIQQASYEMSSSISVDYQNLDLSSFNLNTLDKYFDDMFEVFADCFLNPGFNEEEYATIVQDFLQAKQQRMGDTYARATFVLNRDFFGDHPYSRDYDGSLETLPTITIDDVKDHYQNELVADRMFIVAVGNFDRNKLSTQLESTFGTLETKGLTTELMPIPTISETTLILEPFEQAQDLAEVRGNFVIPEPSHPSYAAFTLASAMMKDILFDIVRTRNSAAYSTWLHVFSYKSNYGNVSAYRTNTPSTVKKMLDDSLAVLATGYAFPIEPKTDAEGFTIFVPIKESLEAYQNQFLTEFYSAQQTNLSVANSIATSYFLHGDPTYYLEFEEKILEVTPEDIVEVAQKYLIETPKKWIVLGSQEMLDTVDESLYLEYQGSFNP